MRLAALAVLVINLLTNQVLAENATQPLTRADCEEAEMAWDENVNVCVAKSGDVLSQPLTRFNCAQTGLAWDDNANVCGTHVAGPVVKPEAPAALSQPLTKSDCNTAGMTWNDGANVCGGSASQAAINEISPTASTVLINISKTRQRMTVLVDGAERYDWPVSTGLPGYSTPSGSYSATSMNEIWYSREWDDAPMPHSVFFTTKGHAIHGTNEVKRLGKPASHGCVRLAPQNAAKLYDLVKRNGLDNTEIVLVGHTPGGESKVASPSKSKPYTRPQRAARGDESYDRPRRRGGIFRRLFGRR